jgi:hypothetical protein
MNKTNILLFVFFMFSLKSITAQINKKVYVTKFHPESVTYNGSPNPNECWESVAWGITIKIKKNNSFFLISYEAFEQLKEKIGESKVEIEVAFYDEPVDGSGAVGCVTKIVLDGKVLYENR